MKMIDAEQITTSMNGSTLEIFINGNLAAEISDGKMELDFVYDVLQGMGYEVNEEHAAGPLLSLNNSTHIRRFEQ